MPNAASAVREPMRVGQNGLTVIKAFESCMAGIKARPGFFKPYKDSAGVLTIGWGHTNHHLPRFDGNTFWSQQQCDDALAGDMQVFERWVSGLAKVTLTQNEFDALALKLQVEQLQARLAESKTTADPKPPPFDQNATS